jgi:hypothetical protein
MKTPYLDQMIEMLENHIEHTEAITHDGIPETRAELAEYKAIKKQNAELLEGLKEFRERIYQQSFTNMQLREMVDSLISTQTKEKNETTDRS